MAQIYEIDTLAVRPGRGGASRARFGGRVDVYVRRLCERVEDDPAHPVQLITVRGMGYRFK